MPYVFFICKVIEYPDDFFFSKDAFLFFDVSRGANIK